MSSPERICLAGQNVDVLIIGGGINGIAIARECARSGKKVAVVEQNDFASGSTSRSTRIIHGGLRYLEHGEIALVRHSLRERERLLRRYPHLVRSMQFLLALNSDQHTLMRSPLAVRAGLWLYHRWAGAPATIRNHADEFERRLEAGNSWCVYRYDDAQCEFPERLVAEWLAEAAAFGAVVCNYTQALEILCQNGKVTGARLRDTTSCREFEISAPQIVNASGPWADFVLRSSGIGSKPLVGGVRGSHILLPQFPGSPHNAIYAEAQDGRQIFVIPWNGQVLVGTTEVADSGDPGKTYPAPSEIDYLFEGFSRLFADSGLTKNDIRYAFAGVRPLPYSPGKNIAEVTRKHKLHDHAQDGARGLISIIGGKLTTAMGLAREVARKLGIANEEPANVLAAVAPANGIESTLKQWAHLVACRAQIPECSAEAIATWHGRRALAIACAASLHENLRRPLCDHSDHIVAEAIEAVMHESAVTLADILLRRVPVALGPCWSETCSLDAATRVGAVLGWSPGEMHNQFERCEHERRA
ncbi:MAG TPA: glycerol-3-phosphate dehydrogenase/oxidase, partial [Candidatus Angelobacter sp.]